MKFDVKRVSAAEAHDALKALKEEGYNVLLDMTAVDYSAYRPGAASKGDASDRLKRAHPAEEEDLTHAIASARGEEYGTPHLPTRDALDEPRPQAPVPERFDVVYRLVKIDAATGEDRGRVELRCGVPEGEPVLRSVMSLWPIADWLEREVWDMFGIKFADRPDIKRLLLYESFVGHPLRKDYPITKRQPLVGPASGEPANNPSFNEIRPTIKYD
jgi:NADH-quinone oxidoreductase subunit C